jgi:hypothetical protein
MRLQSALASSTLRGRVNPNAVHLQPSFYTTMATTQRLRARQARK